MSIRNSPSGHGFAARILHWSAALLIASTAPIGWWANSIERGALERMLFDLHFQMGLLILLLVLARLLRRMLDLSPTPRAGNSSGLAVAATLTHLLLYLSLLAMIVSGYVIQVHMRPSLEILGFQGIPRLFQPPDGEGLRAFAWYVHHYGFWLLLGLIALHVGAALWHHFVRRDDVLLRMLPFRRRNAEGSEARKEPGCDGTEP